MTVKNTRSLLGNTQIDADAIARIASTLAKYGIKNVTFSVNEFSILTEYIKHPTPSTVEATFEKEETDEEDQIIFCKLVVLVSRFNKRHTITISGSIRGDISDELEPIVLNGLYSFLASTVEVNNYKHGYLIDEMKIPQNLSSMYPNSIAWEHLMKRSFFYYGKLHRMDNEEVKKPEFICSEKEGWTDLNEAYNAELSRIHERNK